MSLSSPHKIRNQFPALHQKINGQLPIFFDGPGGTQVPQRVINAISEFWQQGNSNIGGSFAASEKISQLVDHARQVACDLLGANNKKSIVFGANMTTLTFHISRSIAQNWQAGDNIILSELDHGANRSCWEALAIEKNVTVQYIKIKDNRCELNLEQFRLMINQRTQLVAITGACNLTGNITPIEEIVALARTYQALTYVDAVHLVPHKKVNVELLGCDFLVCSSYKFFGPHLGVLYAKLEVLEKLKPQKVKPASNALPNCWETGTANFSALAGFIAAVEYMASLGEGSTLQKQLECAYKNISDIEHSQAQYFLKKLKTFQQITLIGLPINQEARTATFALQFTDVSPHEIAKRLGENNIYTWAGHMYADQLIEALNINKSEGVLRVGITHYNTHEEIDYFFNKLEQILNSD